MHNGGKSVHNEIDSNEKLSKKEESLFTPFNYLALHREATIEEIAKQTGKNYSTILRATHQLLKRGFVYARFERTAPKGKELRYYALTFQGLIMYLSRKLDRSDVREIAKAHEDTLLIFKKWEKFAKAECEQEIFLRLTDALNFELQRNTAQYNLDFLPSFGRIPHKDNAIGPRDIFDAAVLGLIFMDRPVEYVRESHPQRWSALEKIWRVVESDYELRKRRDEFLSYLEREHTEGVKAISEWRKYLKQEEGRSSEKTVV